VNFSGEVAWFIMDEADTIVNIVFAWFLPAIFYLAQFKFRIVKWGVVSVIVLCIGTFAAVFSLSEAVDQFPAE
jgi:hypothetical protein